ncbi:MAG: AbrB/MazE/SpoVT family DNA-binding domain-containing protein, partial [Chloroflexota bacterium]
YNRGAVGDMTTKVGPKGQVVIEKEIRDKLGVEPGSLAVQRLVDDHVEIRFLPPVRLHNRSLLGILRPYSDVTVPPEEWQAAREKAWEAAAWEAEKWRLDPENLKP